MQRASAAHPVSRARVSLQLELAPAELAHLDGLLRRSTPTGRVRRWTLRHATQGEVTAEGPRPRAIFNDPEAIAEAARLGLGVALLPVPFVAASLARGALVRLLPGWHQEVGRVPLLLEPHAAARENARVRRLRAGALRGRRLRGACGRTDEARAGYCSAITSTNTRGTLPVLVSPWDSPLRTMVTSPGFTGTSLPSLSLKVPVPETMT